METDKHYLQVGTFVLVTLAALALFGVWLAGSYNNGQYNPYLIRFNESVSGLEVGGPVKFRGIHVGKVDAMSIDPTNINQIRVDVSILKNTPIKTDTVASLKLQGITGVIYIELSGSTPEAPVLVSADADNPPEIPAEPSTLATLMDMLPQILDKVSHISDQADKLFSNKNISAISGMIGNLQKATKNASDLTDELKENPTKLIFAPKRQREGQDQ